MKTSTQLPKIMDNNGFLFQALIYLSAAVIAVPISKKLGLGSVLGYLLAGIVIGPWGLKLITEIEDILHFSEFGVVLLLFLIGLELNPGRLWKLKKTIIGMGGTQVLFSAVVLACLCFALNFQLNTAIIAGMGFALSSTAIAIQSINERNLLNTHAGNSAFSTLLFQDIAVIPMLALIPLLGGSPATGGDSNTLLSIIKVISVIAIIIVGGRYLLRPIFRIIAGTELREIFTAFSLLLVIGIGLLMQAVDMSMALGTFMAGVILSDSEYRHELEIDIEPFKGLLLGLFFISVGMAINLGLFFSKPLLVIGLMIALVFFKGIVLLIIAKLFKLKHGENYIFTFLICQGGEFAFVLFSVAKAAGILTAEISELFIVVVALSMTTTPFLLILYDKYIEPRYRTLGEQPKTKIQSEDNPVIIAGFGRFGQVIGRLLHSRQIGTTILDHDPGNIEMVRKYGYKVFYGDASRIDLLKTAGADKAKILVLATDDSEAIIATIKKVKEHFPNLQIVARAEDRTMAFELMSLGVQIFTRATYYSALHLGEETLKVLGYGAYEAKQAAQKFDRHDIKTLTDHHPYHQDEVKRISLAKEAKKELEEIFMSDEKAFSKNTDSSWG